MAVDPPALPEDRLREQGWVRIDDSEDTLASLPGVTVRGRTVVFGDQDLRDAVEAATDPPLDQPWRFLFATRLSLSPTPPQGIGPSMFASIVRSRANEGFVGRLRERGYTDIDEGRTDEIRVETGDRARVTAYTATDEIDHGGRVLSLPVAGHLGVWHHDGSFRVAGGAYPRTNIGDVLGVDVQTDPGTFRNELLEYLRAVA